jgi:hypothetical protein
MPGRRQAFVAAFGVLTYRITVVVLGRQYGILAGTNGVVNRVISAAAAQANMGAVAFLVAPMR